MRLGDGDALDDPVEIRLCPVAECSGRLSHGLHYHDLSGWAGVRVRSLEQ